LPEPLTEQFTDLANEPASFVMQDNQLRLEFIIMTPQWLDFYTHHQTLLSQVGFAAFKEGDLKENPDRMHQINIILCDDSFIQNLNQQHRGIDKPTNVLSFPTYDRDELDAETYCFGDFQIFGDVFIAYNYCISEAEKTHKKIHNHIAHMITHGVLHILSYDHIDDDEAEIMETLEIEILNHFNIENPYQEI
jgi:probable rRNA maturation factor